MEKKCNDYTPEDISSFVDNELPYSLYHAMEQHLNHCQDCKRLAEAYTTMSAFFSDHAHQEILKIDPAKLEQKLAHTLENSKSKKKSPGNILGFFGKKIYFKLASISIVAILMISLYTFHEDHPSGPSAIVKSVDTDFASVMIIETQKEQHTIIWFSET